MKSINSFTSRLQAAALVGCLIAGLSVGAGFLLGGQEAAPGGIDVDRHLTYVSTDKPIYRTGEKLYVRGVILNADTHSPMAGPQASSGTASFTIKGPKGDTVASGYTSIVDSIAGFSWEIPAGQAGGEYTVRVSDRQGGAPAERKFDIRAYRAPRLKSQIVFVRDGYGPGDMVSANLHVERAEGGNPAGAKVSVSARVDGAETWSGTTTVDSFGNAGAIFKLPAAIARGEGVIAMIVQDGGTVETATKTIPILLQTVDLAIYPEGGDLIAGLANRVYLEGKTPARKPADMAGIIVNTSGKQVASFRTEHEGRGRFSFVPKKGEAYSLHVTEPAGIKTVFQLPAVKESGIVLSSTSDVIGRRNDIVVRVAATAAGSYGITLSQHGKEVASKSIMLRANYPTEVPLVVPQSLDGVIVATVYGDHKTPLAERLLFRQPEHNIKVQITPDRADYVPGDKVTLRVATTDETGEPVSAMVGLSVTDSSVLEMIEKREQAPRLPVMVLLESDVKDLADAHVYMDATNPRAPLATDLLLGTQGWRRFATVDPIKFTNAFGDAARRVLAPGISLVTVRGASSIGGTVMDTTKALIPGVIITLTNTQTGVFDTRVTNDSGSFQFPSVPAGTYKLTGDLTGFRQAVNPRVTLAAEFQVRADLVMQIGNRGDAVTVSIADMPLTVHETSSSVGEVLEADRIRTLPLVGGNVLDLLTVLPGFRESQFGVPFDTVGSLGLDTVNTTINGMTTNSSRNSADIYGYQVFTPMKMNPDLVGEIRLILTPVDADLKRERAGGGAFGSGQVASRVREYAHSLRSSWTEGSREDFAETVYWNAGVKTDPSSGMASVSFNLSDSVTSFRVLADAFSQNGTLGSGISEVESVKPFSIEPKMPLQVTSGDVIQLPVGIINGMNRDLHDAKVTVDEAGGIPFIMLGDESATLSSKGRTRQFAQFDIANTFSGSANLTFGGQAGAFRDTVRRTLDVQPMGFPHAGSMGGVLESNGSRSFEFTLPNELIRGSLTSSVTVYPTPLASMTDALHALLREPYGCFEQTSSTSYPMIMAQQYFLTHTGVEPAVIEKAKTLLESSYKRLSGFESKTKGYEWFGGSPGHEALTAYGLLEFTDMAQVRNVDKEMMDRTRLWLLGRRDGNGGFSRDTRGHGSGFGSALTDTTNAYITWALVESGEKGLDKEIAAVKALANASQDSYIIALGANILSATGDRAGAGQLMARLAKAQDANGKVIGATTSITQSGGDSLAIEATALSSLAWMRDTKYAPNVEKGMKWIVESNKSGRFGSTQSTVLALRAIVAYDSANAHPKAPGRIVLIVDGKTIGDPLDFTTNTQGALVLPGLGSELGPGKHTIALRMEDGSRMPFSIGVRFNSLLPDSSTEGRVGIQVSLKDTQIQEGAVTEAIVSIANKSDKEIPTPVAIVGIPGGLEIRHDQLKELLKSGKIDAYEVIGREVVLYWRSLRANDKFDLPLSLVAAIPGTYTGPASRAYLYYMDEYKNWAAGLKVVITRR